MGVADQRMGQVRLLAAAGLAALLLALVALLPARVAIGLLGLPDGSAGGIDGTVWNGSVQRLSVGGVTVGPAQWQLQPLRLLAGQLAADVEATLPDGFLNSRLALSWGGNVSLANLQAAAPVALFAPAAGGNAGQLTARFEKITLDGARIETAVGTLQVAGVVLPLPTAGAGVAPGNYTLSFAAIGLGPDEPLTGSIADGGGPLEILGTVTVTPPRSYELAGTAKARPEAPPALVDALRMLGPLTPDGKHVLSLAGSF